jgi:hypothetical protein
MENRKRDTVFPGSDQRSGNNKVSKYAVNSNVEGSPIPGLFKPKANRLKVPRINIPINPLSSYTVPVPLLEESPWNHYKKGYGLELGGSVAVVCKVPATGRLFTMRSCPSSGADEKLYRVRHLKHKNLLDSIEDFSFQDTFYIISEHTEISCEEFIVARPDEVQLAAIIRQVSYSSSAPTRLICYRF